MNVLLHPRTRLRAAALALFAAILLAVGVSAAGADTPPATPQPTAPAQPVNQVVQWNRILLGILNTPGLQPATVHATRSLAIMHVAIYDAVNSIERTSAPYLVSIRSPRDASPDAAAAAAGFTVLASLYPSQHDGLAADLASSLAQVPDGAPKAEGVRTGDAVANALLAVRSDDGSNVVPPIFTPGTQPGDYQLTPPAFTQPVFTHWAAVRPFALRSADQFRPGPPPAVTSKAYASAFQEVKSLGDVNSTTRTADQTQIAQFWNPAIWIAWNNIAETAALGHHDSLTQDARLFALLDITFADSTIAFYDAKYTYDLWRPVTAVRAGDTDGNPATAGDPNWTPLVSAAQDPAYPGAHAVISTDAADVLATFFRSDSFSFSAQSSALPGVERSFTSFSGAANEATLSRIYAGQHFRTDEVAGQRLGDQIARHELQRLLLPEHQGHHFSSYENTR